MIAHINMEQIVRPFADVLSDPNEIPQRDIPPPVQPEAFLRWGRPSEFRATDFRTQARNPIQFQGPEDPEPEKRERFKYKVMSKGGDEITYYHSDDPDQFVTVVQARGITIAGPHSAEARFHIHEAKEPGDETDSGQEPEEPPPLEELNERQQWIEWQHRHSGVFDIP